MCKIKDIFLRVCKRKHQLKSTLLANRLIDSIDFRYVYNNFLKILMQNGSAKYITEIF